jgi:hypothetical protein
MSPAGILLMCLIPAGMVAGGASFLLRLWVSEADSPEARPRHALFIATIFPWVCIAWCLCVRGFWSSVDVNSGRDIGYGDYFRCPLSNGYELTMIDLPDWAWLRETGSSDEIVADIRMLQVAGPWIAGATSADEPFSATATVDSWFLFDTRTRHAKRFASEADLRAAAGFELELKTVAAIYDERRWTPFDGALMYVLLIPPQLAFAWLIYWLKDLRRNAVVALATKD